MTGYLHLVAGKIAAGKSTLAQKLSEEHGCVLLSEDAWLSGLFGPELTSIKDYVRYSARLRDIMGNHVVEVLRLGTSVVLDFPANTPETRLWMREVIDLSGCDHSLHLLNVSDDICKARLHSRNASGEHQFSVSDEEFDAITRHFVRPAASEGFSVREYLETV
ncbi:AAA family ATPase [Roseibium sediminis]|uniref:AAA family ATPase n=1 Tax=Roseibium sediminis TaxID=1775174 RepID=UPI00123CEC15|nr:ATP-binding protein [Roseibium sediminis]